MRAASDVQRLVVNAVALAAVLAVLLGCCIECGVIETNETGDCKCLVRSMFQSENSSLSDIVIGRTGCLPARSCSHWVKHRLPLCWRPSCAKHVHQFSHTSIYTLGIIIAYG